MKIRLILVVILFCEAPSLVFGSAPSLYDAATSSSHVYEQYVHVPEPSHHHHHSPPPRQPPRQESYYHYHVPVVGQGWQPQPHHHQTGMGEHNHLLWALLGLLGLSLLGLKLVPLILIPLALSLLALLGGGAMMMMMGMMMMMMMMPQPNPARSESIGRAFELIEQFGEGPFMGNLTQNLVNYTRSLELEGCPERFLCEIGSHSFPTTERSQNQEKKLRLSPKKISSMLFKMLPNGRIGKMLQSCERAFWTGSNTRDCSNFKCYKIPAKVFKS